MLYEVITPSAGAGSYTITYTYSNGTCSNTATDNITVYALPNVTLTVPPAYDNVCIDEAQFALTGGLPIGGTYYIDGVASINFNPVTQGSIPSPHVVTYSYTNANSCTNTATDNITVHDLPVVGIVGLNPSYNFVYCMLYEVITNLGKQRESCKFCLQNRFKAGLTGGICPLHGCDLFLQGTFLFIQCFNIER